MRCAHSSSEPLTVRKGIMIAQRCAHIPYRMLGTQILPSRTQKQIMFTMDWTIQGSTCTHGMGSGNTS